MYELPSSRPLSASTALRPSVRPKRLGARKEGKKRKKRKKNQRTTAGKKKEKKKESPPEKKSDVRNLTNKIRISSVVTPAVKVICNKVYVAIIIIIIMIITIVILFLKTHHL